MILSILSAASAAGSLGAGVSTALLILPGACNPGSLIVYDQTFFCRCSGSSYQTEAACGKGISCITAAPQAQHQTAALQSCHPRCAEP